MSVCSVLVLLSDDIPDVSAPGRGHTGGHTGGLQNGNVSHPFVTQTYCCVAAYETKDTKNQPFKVAVDEKLDVLIKDPAGRIHIQEHLVECLIYKQKPKSHFLIS